MKTTERLTREQACEKWLRFRAAPRADIEPAFLDGWDGALANSPLPQVVEALTGVLAVIQAQEESTVGKGVWLHDWTMGNVFGSGPSYRDEHKADCRVCVARAALEAAKDGDEMDDATAVL